jgi:hypothetical protein
MMIRRTCDSKGKMIHYSGWAYLDSALQVDVLTLRDQAFQMNIEKI